MIIMGEWLSQVEGYEKLEHYFRTYNFQKEDVIVLGGVFSQINNIFVKNLQNLLQDYNSCLYGCPKEGDSLDYHPFRENGQNVIKSNLIAIGNNSLVYSGLCLGNLNNFFGEEILKVNITEFYDFIIAPTVPIDFLKTDKIDRRSPIMSLKLSSIFNDIANHNVKNYIFSNNNFVRIVDKSITYYGLPPYYIIYI